MTYTHGQSDAYRLRQEKEALLTELAQVLTAYRADSDRLTHSEELLAIAKARADRVRGNARNTLNRAERAEAKVRAEAETILTAARGKACRIILDAENQAALIRERAYDQGWALADRDYLTAKVRQADEARAKKTILTKAA